MTSPGPITLMPRSSPRSANCFMKLPPWPAGTNTKIASGLASFTRCRNGAKSGLASGTLTSSTIWPPPAVKRLEEVQRVGARRVIGDQRRDLLDAVLRRPVADDGRGLRQRERGAHDIGRALGDDRGAAAITISGTFA